MIKPKILLRLDSAGVTTGVALLIGGVQVDAEVEEIAAYPDRAFVWEMPLDDRLRSAELVTAWILGSDS